MHVTMDSKFSEGPDHKLSLEPIVLARTVSHIRNTEKTLKEIPETKLNTGEIVVKEYLGKSLITKCDVKKGERMTRDKLTTKCPGLFMSPLSIDDIIFLKAKYDIPKDTFIDVDDFE
jgi:sialic acid synthase SpsE